MSNRAQLVREAIDQDNQSALSALLQDRRNLRVKIDADESAWLYACRLGSLATIRQFLDNGANVNERVETDRRTPLMLVRMQADGAVPLPAYVTVSRDNPKNSRYAENIVAIMELLLDRGAKIEARDWQGRTALMHAAMMGRELAVEMLLKRGANVSVKDDAGNSITELTLMAHKEYFLMPGTKKMLELLIEAGAEETLFTAIRRGNDAGVYQLLDHGANVQAVDMIGKTPLHYAVQSMKPDLVKKLIVRGAPVDIRDKEGRTPLMQVLETWPASGRWYTKEGRPPVILPLDAKHITMLDLLIDQGSDILVRDHRGVSVLDYAGRRDVLNEVKEQLATRVINDQRSTREDRAKAHILMARSAENQRQDERALKAWQVVVNDYGDTTACAQALEGMVAWCEKKEQWDGLISICEKMIEWESHLPPEEASRRAGQPDRAAKAYETMAHAYYAKGAYAEALRILREKPATLSQTSGGGTSRSDDSVREKMMFEALCLEHLGFQFEAAAIYYELLFGRINYRSNLPEVQRRFVELYVAAGQEDEIEDLIQVQVANWRAFVSGPNLRTMPDNGTPVLPTMSQQQACDFYGRLMMYRAVRDQDWNKLSAILLDPSADACELEHEKCQGSWFPDLTTEAADLLV